MAGRRVDDVRAGTIHVPVPALDGHAVLHRVAVGVEELAEADEALRFLRQLRVGQPLPDDLPRGVVLHSGVGCGGEDQPVAVEVVVALCVHLAARVDLPDPVVDQESAVLILFDGERAVVPGIALERGMHLLRRRLARVGERLAVARHDVHGHVAAVAVGDVAEGVEVVGRHPGTVLVLDVPSNELVGADDRIARARIERRLDGRVLHRHFRRLPGTAGEGEGQTDEHRDGEGESLSAHHSLLISAYAVPTPRTVHTSPRPRSCDVSRQTRGRRHPRRAVLRSADPRARTTTGSGCK